MGVAGGKVGMDVDRTEYLSLSGVNSAIRDCSLGDGEPLNLCDIR